MDQETFLMLLCFVFVATVVETSPDWPATDCVDQDGLKLAVILLLPPPKHWAYRCAATCLADTPF